MRSIRSLVILGSLLALVPTVRAQEAPASVAGGSLFAVLVGGDAGGTGATSSRFAWAPDTTTAVGISKALVAGGNPMAAGWVKLALGGQPRSITPGSFDPAAVYDLRDASLTIYGGNTPATWTSQDGTVIAFPAPGAVPPVATDDSSAVTVPHGDLPLLGIEVKVPTEGGFGEAIVTLANPDGSVYASRTVTFPDGGWWAFKLDGPTLDTPVEEPDEETPPPTTAESPEPATLLMAALGAVGLAGWRGRRMVSRASKKRGLTS